MELGREEASQLKPYLPSSCRRCWHSAALRCPERICCRAWSWAPSSGPAASPCSSVASWHSRTSWRPERKRNSRKWEDTNRNICNCFDSKHFHIHSKTQTILYENVGPLPAIRLIQKERLEAEDRGRVRLQSGSLKLSFKKHPRRSRETSQHASCLYQHHVETFNTSKRQQTQRLIN